MPKIAEINPTNINNTPIAEEIQATNFNVFIFVSLINLKKKVLLILNVTKKTVQIVDIQLILINNK